MTDINKVEVFAGDKTCEFPREIEISYREFDPERDYVTCSQCRWEYAVIEAINCTPCTCWGYYYFCPQCGSHESR